MAEKIKVLIVDDEAAARNYLRKMIDLEHDMEVVAEVSSGEDAIDKAKRMPVGIILMDQDMPGMDGVAAAEEICANNPNSLIILLGEKVDQDFIRRAMFAGIKEYLIKPVSSDELLSCIRHVFLREQRRMLRYNPVVKGPSRGKVVTIFSTKGGIGKTTITSNLVVALGLDKKSKICIFDTDLQFGDVALCLNVVPAVTVYELVLGFDQLDESWLKKHMTKYSENIDLLAAPLRPEDADVITAEHVGAIIQELSSCYDYVVVDTAPMFSDITFRTLDVSDLIIVATSQDLFTVKNVKLCLETLDSLNYPREKIKIVLNRANSLGGMNIQHTESLINRKLLTWLPSDGRTVVTAANKGIPFVVGEPGAPIAKTVMGLAKYVSTGDEQYIVNYTGTSFMKKISNLLKLD